MKKLTFAVLLLFALSPIQGGADSPAESLGRGFGEGLPRGIGKGIREILESSCGTNACIDCFDWSVKMEVAASEDRDRSIAWSIQRGWLAGLSLQELLSYVQENGSIEKKLAIMELAASEFAIHPSDSDGPAAILFAATLCRTRGWDNPTCLELYAAALAELGNYSDAIKHQRTLITFLQGQGQVPSVIASAEERLSAYVGHRPWRRKLADDERKSREIINLPLR